MITQNSSTLPLVSPSQRGFRGWDGHKFYSHTARPANGSTMVIHSVSSISTIPPCILYRRFLYFMSLRWQGLFILAIKGDKRARLLGVHKCKTSRVYHGESWAISANLDGFCCTNDSSHSGIDCIKNSSNTNSWGIWTCPKSRHIYEKWPRQEPFFVK